MQHKSLSLYPAMTDDVFAHGGRDDGEKFVCIVDVRDTLVLVDTSIMPVSL